MIIVNLSLKKSNKNYNKYLLYIWKLQVQSHVLHAQYDFLKTRHFEYNITLQLIEDFFNHFKYKKLSKDLFYLIILDLKQRLYILNYLNFFILHLV